MEAVQFTDPVTKESFTSADYDVLNNPSGGGYMRARAPSGAIAMRGIQAAMDAHTEEHQTEYDAEFDDGNLFDEDTDFSDEVLVNAPGDIIKRVARGAQKLGVSVGGFGWQALRLPESMAGGRGLTQQTLDFFKRLGVDGKTIRNGPHSQLITARQWQDYLNNMEMADVGAELSVDVSAEERLALFRFVEEWDSDPAHTLFRRRLHNTQGVVANEEIAKGVMVYDLMTGMLPGPGVPAGNLRHDKMFRLAFDILDSIRFREYNFYTLNLVHAEEGTAIYDEFMNNYVPLSPDEVSVIHEVMQNVGVTGMSYVLQVTNPNGDPAGALAYMENLEDAYMNGNTALCRLLLETLRGHPYNFRPNVGITGIPAAQRGGNVVVIYADLNKQMRWLMDKEGALNQRNQNQWRKHGVKKIGEHLTAGGSRRLYELQRPDDFSSVIGAWNWPVGSSKDKDAIFIPIQELERLTEESQQGAQQQQGGRRRFGGGGGGGRGGGGRRGRGPRPNPGGTRSGTRVVGRGKYYMVQINPKSKLQLATRGAKKEDGTYKGKDSPEKHGNTRAERKAGITDTFGGKGARAVQSYGTHKSTGTNEPYLIFLPTADFRKASKTVDGVTIRTIVPKRKTNKAHMEAWDKFVKIYGLPKAAPTKGLPTRFVIHKPTRGTYYRGLAKKMKQ